jgi:hypothetical protein
MFRSNPCSAVPTNKESLGRLEWSTAHGYVPQRSSSVRFDDTRLRYSSTYCDETRAGIVR